MVRFEPGTWVWIHDDQECHLPAKVLKSFAKGEPAALMTEDGEVRELTEKQTSVCESCHAEAMDSSIRDLVHLSDLNEMSILHNLRIRFKEDKIYTNISSILISVNPFKLLPLYTPEVLESYRNVSLADREPHIFGVASNAYRNMLSDSTNQSVVISGESGAGKSEATKLILQFLTDVSRKHGGVAAAETAAGTASSSLEARILAANPILESFGNAKTLRNNNSSRFGKLITVDFDQRGAIIGGGIINYLLEKSRVVSQTKGERNYHIFYQLLSAAAAEGDGSFLSSMHLQDPALFYYTNQGQCTVDGASDNQDFQDMQHSMDTLQFDRDLQQNIFQVVAGVLHCGNLKFQVEKKPTAEDASSIANLDVLQHAAALWGCSASDMHKFLTNRHIGNKSLILVPYSCQQAMDARDAMTKRVYAELFQFIVNKINAELSSSSAGGKRHTFIGVLDIFGFESFEVNSFEQLCINYCNEKLQFHFNEHIFKMEQELYMSEGISIPGTMFVDNKPTLDLLEAKATGVFSMIDEEINVPRGSDEGLLQKLMTRYADGKHSSFQRPKAKDCKNFLKNFGVVHYAGPVFYFVSGFLDKNKDQLHADIVTVLQKSTHPLVQRLFPVEVVEPVVHVGRGRGASSASAAKKTLGSQFKTQLNDLIATLNSTAPHFVRCMKSNDLKQGNVFSSARMQDQLRYSGLVEVCRIRKLGFPIRRSFEEFLKRYKCLERGCDSVDRLLDSLVRRQLLKEGQWARGRSKVFLRAQLHSELEAHREGSLAVLAVSVQKNVRRLLCVRKYAYYKKVLTELAQAMAARDESRLSSLLDACFELPCNGKRVQRVGDARRLLERIQEEKRITRSLETALAARDLQGLQYALSAHRAMDPPFESPLALQARDLLVRLEEEALLKGRLAKAMERRDEESLRSIVSRVEEAGLEIDCLQARSLLERLAQERALLARLGEAITDEDQKMNLEAIYLECVREGLETHYAEKLNCAKDMLRLLTEQRKRQEEEEKRRLLEEKRLEVNRKVHIAQVRARLEELSRSKNQEALQLAIQSALQTGVQIPEVARAQKRLELLKSADRLSVDLQTTLELLKSKSESGLGDLDVLPLANFVDQLEQVYVELEEECVELKEAKIRLEQYHKEVDVRSELERAIAKKDRKLLRCAIDHAQDLKMHVPELRVAVEMLQVKEKGSSLREQDREEVATVAAAPVAEDLDVRYAFAKQARFEYRNFPNLRSADEFARGTILNKSKVKESFLVFQTNPLPKSLTDLKTREFNKLAVNMHKNIMGYMGDTQLPFPSMLAHDLLKKGSHYKPLRDEIYLLIIKQLTNNPRAESIAKGWQLLCMCVGTFVPSKEFENFLLHFILEKREKGRGAVVEYARYCLRTLEALLQAGDGTGFVLSVDEIMAYKERPPILATIYLVDGSCLTENLPVTPDLDVGKLVELCSNWLDLKDPSRVRTLGLFIYDLGVKPGLEDPNAHAAYADLKRTPRALRNEEFLGDIFVQKDRQKRAFKIVLKQKIFLPRLFPRGRCSSFERLKFLQAEDEAILQGNLELRDLEEVLTLSSLSIAVAMGDDFDYSDDEALDWLSFVPPQWRNDKSPEMWAQLLRSRLAELAGVPPEELQQRFLRIVEQNPFYGSHLFYVHRLEYHNLVGVPESIRKLPRDLIIGFNLEGMHIYNARKKWLVSFPYMDICRWGGNSSQFCLVMIDQTSNESFDFNVATAQAADMAAVIIDHIRTIIAEEREDP